MRVLFVFVVLSHSLLAAGCGGPTRARADETVTAAPLPDLAAPPASAAVLAQMGCAACHDSGDASYAGHVLARSGRLSYAPNLTPDDATGLGSWSDRQIIAAVRDGVDPTGAPLCTSMPRYSSMSDAEAWALVAALRALPSRHSPGVELACDAPASATPVDGGVPSVDGAADLAPSVPACRPLLNEVQTQGLAGADDQFVEIYNPCGAAFDLTGARLVYRVSDGDGDVVLARVAQVAVAPRQFFVFGQLGFLGLADAYFTTRMAAAGGSVALLDANGLVLDSVGWGSAASAYVLGHPAPAPAADGSVGRIPDGQDTRRNQFDFQPTLWPTPGRANW